MASFKMTLCACALLPALVFLGSGLGLPTGSCGVPVRLRQLLRLSRPLPSDVDFLSAILRQGDARDHFREDTSGASGDLRRAGSGVGASSCPERVPPNGSLAERSTCPWVLGFDEDSERVPSRMVKAAPCTYNCIKVTDEPGSERTFSFGVCEPVFWNVRVQRRRCNLLTGVFEYVPAWEKVPVAFTCAFPKKHHHHEHVLHAQMPFGPTPMI